MTILILVVGGMMPLAMGMAVRLIPVVELISFILFTQPLCILHHLALIL